MNKIIKNMALVSVAVLALSCATNISVKTYYEIQQQELLLKVERLAFDVARQILGL